MTPKKRLINTVVFWGTYDTGKPRVRLLLQGLREHNITVIECRKDIWAGVEDKSQLKTLRSKILRIFYWAVSYPRLLLRYLSLPRHDAVICTYPGAVDVLLIACLTRLRCVPLIWDIFISLYDTVVEDRKLVSSLSPAAMLLFFVEWAGCRSANALIMDTAVHARAMEKLFCLPTNTIDVVPVGCESNVFKPMTRPHPNKKTCTLLFYGQFIPLHGIEVIIRAMKHIQEIDRTVQCKLIGMGQEQVRIDTLIQELQLKNIERIDWVPYTSLPLYVHEVDINLGIFRGHGKALRVIPNKAYQILAMGSILVTGDTPAAREALGHLPQVRLVFPEDHRALATEILELCCTIKKGKTPVKYPPYIIDARMVGKKLLTILENT